MSGKEKERRSAFRTLPEAVCEKEKEYLKARRAAAGVSVNGPLVGVALSGGGIRSATFSLGVLQVLADIGALKFADFLCTVSGGGYIGGCLTSYLTLIDPKDRKPTGWRLFKKGRDPQELREERYFSWKKKHRFDLGANMPFNQKEPVHHLRKYGHFLVTQAGLFRREVIRALGSVVLGVAMTWALFVATLTTVVGVLLLYGTYFAPGQDVWQAVDASPFPGFLNAFSLLALDPRDGVPVFLGGLLLSFAWAVVAFAMRRKGRLIPGETEPGTRERRVLRRYSTYSAVSILGLALWRCDDETRRWSGLLLPLVGVAGAWTSAALLYITLARVGKQGIWSRGNRSVGQGLVGVATYGILACVSLPLTVIALWWLQGPVAGPAVGAGASLVVTRFFALRGQQSDEKTGLMAVLRRTVPQLGLALAVPVFLVCMLLLASQVVLAMHFYNGWLLLGGGAAAGVMLGAVVNYNRVSPHYFYRDRLADAYLQTEARVPPPKDAKQPDELVWDIVRDDYDLLLTELHKGGVQTSGAPYHLIQCALNLPGSRDLARRSRKSDHFVFSRYYVGSTTTGWVGTEQYANGKMELIRALTISGAAASSAMGFQTSFVRAFALTLFNVRLGYWLPNPDRYPKRILSPEWQVTPLEEKVSKTVKPEVPSVPTPPMPTPTAPEKPAVEDDSKPVPERNVPIWLKNLYKVLTSRPGEATAAPSATPTAPEKATEKRSNMAAPWSRSPLFWPRYLFKELTASADASAPYVNLSDGGHTGDNIGIYPLLQRRCRLIIVVDGECDPEYTFGSFSSAVRQIFTDENVTVEMNLDAIRPSSSEKRSQARAHFTVGRVTYPEPNAETGWIIYMKSSYRGFDEPASVKTYATENVEFPHQSTADQFFSDTQFEAYRALGGHVAKTALLDLYPPGAQTGGWLKWCEAKWREGQPK